VVVSGIIIGRICASPRVEIDTIAESAIANIEIVKMTGFILMTSVAAA
jgi:hypothetical protein